MLCESKNIGVDGNKYRFSSVLQREPAVGESRQEEKREYLPEQLPQSESE